METISHSNRGVPTVEEYLAWRRTHPPMWGADPTEDETGATSGDTETTASTTSGGTSGSPTDQPFEAPFRLEDIEDEGVRGHVQRYHAQLQGAFTRKTQELANQRKALEKHQELIAALDSDDEATRDAGIRALLKAQGWELEDDDDDAAAQAAAAAATTTSTTESESDLAQRLAAIEQRDQAREEREQQDRLEAFRVSTEQKLASYFKEIGLDPRKEGDADAILRERHAIVGYTASLDPTADELPDVEKAIILRKADRAALVPPAAKPGYRESKDTPNVDASGASGSPANPPGTRGGPDAEAARMQRMLDVAGRHF